MTTSGQENGEEDIDRFMEGPQYAEQMHRMAGMLDQSIMSVIEERKEVGSIFSSPLDSWYATDFRFRGLAPPQSDVEQGNTAASTGM